MTVKDLSSFVVKSVKEIEHVMNVGNTNRATGKFIKARSVVILMKF